MNRLHQTWLSPRIVSRCAEVEYYLGQYLDKGHQESLDNAYASFAAIRSIAIVLNSPGLKLGSLGLLEGINAARAQNPMSDVVRDSIASISLNLSNYPTYMKNGGIDRESWFADQVNSIRKELNESPIMVGYGMSRREVLEIAEDTPRFTKLGDTEKGEVLALVESIGAKRIHELINSPDDVKAREKTVQLLTSLMKATDDNLTANYFWVTAAYIECKRVAGRKLTPQFVSTLSSVATSMKVASAGNALSKKKIRKNLFATVRAIVESPKDSKIRTSVLEHFNLIDAAQQARAEARVDLDPIEYEVAYGTKLIPELIDTCHLLLGQRQAHFEPEVAVTVKSVNDTLIAIGAEDRLLSMDPEKEHLQELVAWLTTVGKGPAFQGAVKAGPIEDYKHYSQVRALMYSALKGLDSQGAIDGKDQATLIDLASKIESGRYLGPLLGKWARLAASTEGSALMQIMNAGASLFKYLDEHIENQQTDREYIKTADKYLASWDSVKMDVELQDPLSNDEVAMAILQSAVEADEVDSQALARYLTAYASMAIVHDPAAILISDWIRREPEASTAAVEPIVADIREGTFFKAGYIVPARVAQLALGSKEEVRALSQIAESLMAGTSPMEMTGAFHNLVGAMSSKAGQTSIGLAKDIDQRLQTGQGSVSIVEMSACLNRLTLEPGFIETDEHVSATDEPAFEQGMHKERYLLEDELDSKWPDIERALETFQKKTIPKWAKDALRHSMHTLKGTAGLVGERQIQESLHLAEEFMASFKLSIIDDSRSNRDLFVRLVREIESAVNEPSADGVMKEVTEQIRMRVEGKSIDVPEVAETVSWPEPARDIPVIEGPLKRTRKVRIESDSLNGLFNDTLGIQTRVERAGVQSKSRIRSLRSTEFGLKRTQQEIETIGRILSTSRGAGQSGIDTSYVRLKQSVEYLSHSLNILNSLEHASTRTLTEMKNRATIVMDEVQSSVQLDISQIQERMNQVVSQTAAAGGKKVWVEVVCTAESINSVLYGSIESHLYQLVKNSVYHGIETPEVRSIAGKDPVGTIRVNLSNWGGFFKASIKDDGQGIQISGKAESMSSLADVMSAIAEAGYTTVHKATVEAGRGLGITTAIEDIRRLGGEVELKETGPAGTKMMISVPNYSSPVRCYVFRDCGLTLAIPTHAIRSIRPGQGTSSMARMVELTGVGADQPLRLPGKAVAVETQGSGLVCAADEDLGIQDMLIRPWPFVNERSMGYSETVDGVPVSVLDPHKVAGEYDKQSNQLKPCLHPQPRIRIESPSIMIVDDSAELRSQLIKAVSELPIQTVEAIDGIDCLNQLKHVKAPRLFVVDLQMPSMDGMTLMRELRKIDAYTEVPIVVLSARGGRQIREQAIECGADYYFQKPFNSKKLSNKIQSLL